MALTLSLCPPVMASFSSLTAFVVAALTSLLSGFTLWASSGALSDCFLFPPVGHISCVVQNWHICSLSCAATGGSRELPGRTDNDNVWASGLLGGLRAPPAPAGKRMCGRGRARVPPSSQFLLRFSALFLTETLQIVANPWVSVQSSEKKLILTIFCHLQPYLTSAFA